MLRSINVKLFVYIGLATLVIFGTFAYLFINHQNKQHIADSFREVNIYSEIVSRATHFNMPRMNRPCIHRMMENIGNQQGIEDVRLFNKDGQIIFSTNKKEIGGYVDMVAESCFKCHASEKPLERLPIKERSRIYQSEDHRVLAMITPYYNKPECYNAACHIHPQGTRVLGVLDIGMSLEGMDAEEGYNRNIFILFTIVTLVCFSLILAFFLHRMITRPVRELVGATEKIAQGDLDLKIPVKRKDEVGQLAVAFNHMVKDLKTANEEIQSWSFELENKVLERSDKLRQAREQLLQSEKMASMGVLASSVAHEINNPLQGILTYIKLMLRIIGGDVVEIDEVRVTEFRNYLQLMASEIERCGGMVKNLLVFSKQSKLNIQEARVNNIIRNSLVLVENKIKLQDVQVELQLQEDIPSIYCDVKQIQQTMIALIINALEAMEKDGKLFITSKTIDNDLVMISIRDTGAGISEEHLKNIFDPFFTTKDSAKSTGLGLFVAYGIIKEHKGTIEVESEPGQGTAFHIKFPIKALV